MSMIEDNVIERTGHPLTDRRKRAEYNEAERQFANVLRQRLQDLLEGKRNSLALLRRYPADPGRLGVIVTPHGVSRDQLRLPVAEALTWEAVRFICADTLGGPISQDLAADGSITECQLFSTKFPHIVVERTDCYAHDGAEPIETTWILRRVQNQRAQTQLNRLLDAANLAFDVIRAFR
jgi:hypothetical protein